MYWQLTKNHIKKSFMESFQIHGIPYHLKNGMEFDNQLDLKVRINKLVDIYFASLAKCNFTEKQWNEACENARRTSFGFPTIAHFIKEKKYDPQDRITEKIQRQVEERHFLLEEEKKKYKPLTEEDSNLIIEELFGDENE